MTGRAHPDASLTDAQVATLGDALVEARRRLAAGRDAAEAAADPGADCILDEGDASRAAQQRQRSLSLSDHRHGELAEVEAALGRLEDGTYGVCEDTGEPIGFPRLQARPWARRCVAAEEAVERGRR